MKTIKKIVEAAKMKGKDPCWTGYQMVGMKDKGGKKVPNCVPEEVQQEAKDEQEYGYEGDMALNQLATLTRCAEMIKDLLKPNTDMPEWVQSKITLATDYIQTAADYMYSEMKEEVESIEEAKGDMNWHRAQENKHEEAGDRMMAKAKSFGAYAHPTGIAARKQAEKHYAKADEHRAARKAASVSEEAITEISDNTAASYVQKRNLQYVKKMKPDSQGRVQPSDVYNKMSDKHKEGVGRAMDRLVKPVEESDTPAKESLQKRSEKPVAYVHEGAFKRIATDKEEDERLAKQKGSWKVETPWKKVSGSGTVVDKSGAKHTPMSRARDLARKAISKKMEEQSNVQPNPFTVPSSNPGQAPKAKKTRQMGIVREAYKDAKKKKETTTGTADKFIEDPELSSKITKS